MERSIDKISEKEMNRKINSLSGLLGSIANLVFIHLLWLVWANEEWLYFAVQFAIYFQFANIILSFNSIKTKPWMFGVSIIVLTIIFLVEKIIL